MKKILLVFVICLICVGCGKQEKNITINIYENSDRSEVQEEIKEKEEIKQENQDQSVIESNKIIIKEKVVESNVSEEQKTIESNIQKGSQSTLDKVEEKITNSYNNAKDWY